MSATFTLQEMATEQEVRDLKARGILNFRRRTLHVFNDGSWADSKTTTLSTMPDTNPLRSVASIQHRQVAVGMCAPNAKTSSLCQCQ